MAKQKARKKISKKVDLTVPLLPVDITTFGTDDDPCFGKLHDLTADECKICGDASICMIVQNQGTEKTRKKVETDNRFKDIELGKSKVSKKEINKFILKKLKENTIQLVVHRLVTNKFKITKEEAKELVKKQKAIWRKQ